MLSAASIGASCESPLCSSSSHASGEHSMHSKVIQSATLQPPVDPSAACSAGHATHQRNTSYSPIRFLKLPPPPSAPISSTIGMISWDDAIFQLLSVLSRKPTLGKKKRVHVSAPMLKFMSGIRARLGRCHVGAAEFGHFGTLFGCMAC